MALEKRMLDGCRTNVIGHVHLFNLFLPLLLRGSTMDGQQKGKCIAITSGHADLDLIAAYNVESAPIYTVDKAAMNTVVAKFSAEFSKDGVLFMSA